MNSPFRAWQSSRARHRLTVALLGAWLAGPWSLATAQEDGEQSDEVDLLAGFDIARPLEEVVVVGRQKVTVIDIQAERMELDAVADFLDAEAIARNGDTLVSLALRRVPGVTLVNGQFIYVRGLGERYSTVLLNGAYVPSPDLTRNVLPLDIFPTAVIESLAVQKTYSPNAPAAFGGGFVDIRTLSIPSAPVLNFDIGSGWNSEFSTTGITTPGGGDDAFGTDDGTRALPTEISDAYQAFQGNIGATNIFNALRRDGGNPAFSDAEAINRQLATALNRNIGFSDKSLDPDLRLEGSAGNSWYLGANENWQFGALVLGKYNNVWRNFERRNRSVVESQDTFSTTLRTVNRVSLTGSLNLGLNFTDDHQISTTSLLLRNTDDEASLTLGNNFNFLRPDGQQLRNYDIRYEERELRSNQIRGSHKLGSDTLAMLPFLDVALLRDLQGDWFYSNSTAQTEIPNEVRISAEDLIVPETGELLQTGLRVSGSAADFRFTSLNDKQESYGFTISKPIYEDSFDLEVSGGWNYTQRARDYYFNRLFLGTTNPDDTSILIGRPEEVLTDEALIDPANRFVLTSGGIGTESYLAAQTINAAFGNADLRFGDHWRISAGLRYEQFNQASLPFNPLQFDVNVGQSAVPNDQLETVVFQENDVYPALSMVWATNNFWAQDFQLRFAASQTVTRPDLREVSIATFIDPLTEARVTGNPDLVTSQLTNIDLRAEWFFSNGDNFTVSLFYKDVANPIETVKQAGTDDNVQLSFVNGESAFYYGLELDVYKDLAAFSETLGDWVAPFYLSGNVFLSDAELTIGDVGLDLTNNVRRPTQHSQYGANIQLGFDSPNEAHSASLIYNVFGPRIFFAERFGAPDAFEQPFNSLDVVYRWFANDRMTVQLRVQNLLNDTVQIQQGGITTIEQTIGTTARLNFSWGY